MIADIEIFLIKLMFTVSYHYDVLPNALKLFDID